MPWDAGAAMDRLQQTTQSVADMKQRKKEANRAMLMQLLNTGIGAGTDIWKTITEPKRQEEAAKASMGPEGSYRMKTEIDSEAEAKKLNLIYDLDIKKMREQSGIDWETLDRQQRAELEAMERQYALRLNEIKESNDYDARKQKIDQDFQMELETSKQRWQTGMQASEQAFAAGESALDRASTEGMAGREIASREGMSAAEIKSREGMSAADRTSQENIERERIALEKQLPRLRTQADFDAWMQKYRSLTGAGMSPMEAEFGYAPVGYGGNVDAKSIEQYRSALNEGLQRGISTIGTAGFITVGDDGRTVENWETLDQDQKDRVLDMVKTALRTAGLNEDNPMWEQYIKLAELHMSYNAYRDDPTLPAPVKVDVNVNGGGGSGYSAYDPQRPAAPTPGSAMKPVEVSIEEQQTTLDLVQQALEKIRGVAALADVRQQLQSAETELGSGRVFSKEQMNKIMQLIERVNASKSGPTQLTPDVLRTLGLNTEG